MQRVAASVGASLLWTWLTPIGASAVDVVGTSAGVSWSAASGPVSGYAVQLSRNGGNYAEIARVTGTAARVSGSVGDTLRVRVAAYNAAGTLGTPSQPSDPITFVQASSPPPDPTPTGGDGAADVNGDGMGDALAYDSKTGRVSALLVQANGSRTWQTLAATPPKGMKPAGFSDVDGDGQADVMWRNSMTGDNALWLLNGTNPTEVALPNEPTRFRVRAFRDFDGDGHADAFFHDASRGTSEVWTLGAGGRTNVLAVDPAPSGSLLATLADVDGDGSADLVWQDPKTGGLEGWLMDGVDPGAVFTLPDAPNGAACAGSGDLDGDGDDDLVWRATHDGKRTIDVWFMDGVNAPATGIAAHPGKKSFVRGVVDVTADGRAEIVQIGKSGFTALQVSATGAVDPAGDMEWTTQMTNLSEVPAAKRWNFLVLE